MASLVPPRHGALVRDPGNAHTQSLANGGRNWSVGDCDWADQVSSPGEGQERVWSCA